MPVGCEGVFIEVEMYCCLYIDACLFRIDSSSDIPARGLHGLTSSTKLKAAYDVDLQTDLLRC